MEKVTKNTFLAFWDRDFWGSLEDENKRCICTDFVKK